MSLCKQPTIKHVLAGQIPSPRPTDDDIVDVEVFFQVCRAGRFRNARLTTVTSVTETHLTTDARPVSIAVLSAGHADVHVVYCPLGGEVVFRDFTLIPAKPHWPKGEKVWIKCVSIFKRPSG